MKKILYYLSNIILGLYLISYIFIQKMIFENLPEYRIDEYGYTRYYTPSDVNDIMMTITLCIIVISCILRLIFNSKKCNIISKSNKVFNIILFIIEIITVYLITVFISFV